MVIDINVTLLRWYWVPLALFAIGLPIYEYFIDGFNILTLLFSPIYIVCCLLAWKIKGAENRKIIICRQYLKINAFSSSNIPWGDILDFGVVHQKLPTGQNCIWLKIYFANNEKYCKKGFFHLMNFPIIEKGIYVCNLANYKKPYDEILSSLNTAFVKYSPNKSLKQDK